MYMRVSLPIRNYSCVAVACIPVPFESHHMNNCNALQKFHTNQAYCIPSYFPGTKSKSDNAKTSCVLTLPYFKFRWKWTQYQSQEHHIFALKPVNNLLISPEHSTKKFMKELVFKISKFHRLLIISSNKSRKKKYQSF